MFYKYHAIPYQAQDPTNEGLYAIAEGYVPQVVYAIEQQKDTNDWVSAADWTQGYQHLCAIQWELLMGRGIERLQMEIRALRGVDELDPGYNDPATDPFTLRMGHIEKVAVLLQGIDAKLQTIINNMANQQSPEELAEIVQELGTIAALLA